MTTETYQIHPTDPFVLGFDQVLAALDALGVTDQADVHSVRIEPGKVFVSRVIRDEDHLPIHVGEQVQTNTTTMIVVAEASGVEVTTEDFTSDYGTTLRVDDAAAIRETLIVARNTIDSVHHNWPAASIHMDRLRELIDQLPTEETK